MDFKLYLYIINLTGMKKPLH